LPALLLRGPGHLPSPLDDRQVAREKGPPAVLDEGELRLQRPASVLEEDAPHAPGLSAVGDPEVSVAGLLEALVAARLVLLADVAADPVEVPGVLLLEVSGGEVRPAAEPRLGTLLDEAPVGVHGGNVGIERMEDEAQASSEEFSAFTLELPGE